MNLDAIENSSKSAPTVWHTFVDNFKEINNSAKIWKRSVPSKKQIILLNNLLMGKDNTEQKKILSGKKVEELTGDEMRVILDEVIESGATFPASDKQVGLIVKLTDKLNLDLSDFLKSNSINDIDELTGGREGSASIIIGKLIEKDGDNLATEPQVKAIKTMAERLGIKVEDAMAIVKTTTIEEINKRDASDLIGKMKKMKKK
jgi:hypothetical protein